MEKIRSGARGAGQAAGVARAGAKPRSKSFAPEIKVEFLFLLSWDAPWALLGLPWFPGGGVKVCSLGSGKQTWGWGENHISIFFRTKGQISNC